MGLYGDISELDSVSSSNLLDEKLIFVRLRVAAPYFMLDKENNVIPLEL